MIDPTINYFDDEEIWCAFCRRYTGHDWNHCPNDIVDVVTEVKDCWPEYEQTPIWDQMINEVHGRALAANRRFDSRAARARKPAANRKRVTPVKPSAD